ncbi:hypothetical protein [Wolbachia endosymbiont (group B) of Camptogramma bilineatum]|uniref:hypothetical protein n=1 Tax=Wolbachia endosymbiont (group B) of Camptogramma bilineatum TaxID=2953991 RepID=UPI00222E9BDE|nr:hypothetical protein [Wolbachia endosymbiont (group B) of Camptogramma bilineatum]
MHSMNQAKTSAGVVTSQTSNETSLFSEEVENNVSDSTLSVKKRIELFEKGTKQTPIIKEKHMKQTCGSHDLKQCNTEYKAAFSNVIRNGSDSSITLEMDEAGADQFDALSSLDEGEDIEDEFNAVCEANGIGYNGGYYPDQFNVAFSTSSNCQTYDKIDVHEEDRKSGDKPKSSPKIVQQDNSRSVAPPSPRTAKNHVSNVIQSIAPSKSSLEVKSYNEENIEELVNADPIYSEINEELANGEPIYSKINQDTKSPKKVLEGSDSGISGNSFGVQRSDLQKLKDNSISDREGASERSSIDTLSDISSNILLHESDQTNSGGVNSETPLIKKEKKTNRILPRVKYTVQQKEFIIFGIAAVALSVSAALVYLQNKAQLVAFFANSTIHVTIPILAVALLVAISPIFCGIKQFRDTEECQIGGKNANETLNQVREYQPKDKVIKSVRLEYSNGTHSHFTLNAWKGKNNFINIDDKVISRRNKVESVIKDRPLFTALLSSLVAANIVWPLLLYVEGGINSVQKFYQNALINNAGLSLLIGSSILALSVIFLGVHYYRKTNCTNLVYCEERIEPEKVNGKFIEEIKEARTKVLEENHSKDAKCSSLTLEQVVVESHNYKDVIYSIS